MSEDKDNLNPFSESMVTAPPTALVASEQQRAIAEVQAQLIIARGNPRDVKNAVDMILMDCTRLALAEEAEYQYAKGGKDIVGPSIRLAETIARRWGNLECGVKELSRHGDVSECAAYAWDLETNFRDVKVFQVRHWRDTKSGGYAITDQREIYERIANDGARRKRACLLAVVPGDVVDAAVSQCRVTLATKVEVTPERIKSMLEKFAGLGVKKEQIEKRIQRHIEALTPPLMLQLGRIYNSVKDGMSSKDDWFGEEPIQQPQRATTKNVKRVKATPDQPIDIESDDIPHPRKRDPQQPDAIGDAKPRF